KFMVQYNGPYRILHAHPEASIYTLNLPDSMRISPTFHASLLKWFVPNGDELF
ncbi:hypothetical protein FKP32DRAFT_1528892, partial [Trametes sanguinea]